MSDQPDRALLESKSRDDLVAMAAALGLEVAPRARKATIIDDILNGSTGGHQSGNDDSANDDPGRRSAEDTDERTPQSDSAKRSSPSDGSTADDQLGGSPSNGKESVKREGCLLYTSPSPRDATLSRMPSSA